MCTGAELLIVGGALQGAAAGQEGEGIANLAKSNEQIARWKAQDAVPLAQFDIRRYQLAVGRMLGSQRAGFAGQGVLVDVGSPADVAADTLLTASFDEQLIYMNAIREKWGLQQQALDFGQQAKNAHKAGIAGALGGVLGGFGNAYGASAP